MSVPRAPSVFESGLDAFSSPYLDKLVRDSIDRAMDTLEVKTPPPGPPSPGHLLDELGNYCSRTALMWARVTEGLLQGPHLEQAAMTAHERSRTDSGMSDLSEVARVDVDIARLRYENPPPPPHPPCPSRPPLGALCRPAYAVASPVAVAVPGRAGRPPAIARADAADDPGARAAKSET